MHIADNSDDEGKHKLALPKPPDSGEFNVECVLNSPYFFAQPVASCTKIGMLAYWRCRHGRNCRMTTAQHTSEAHGKSQHSSGASIVIRPLGPILGAEIIGADVSQHVSADIMEKFRDALHQYKVLVFRDQDLTKEQLIAFSRSGARSASTSCRAPPAPASGRST